MSLRLQKLVANIRKLAAEEKRNSPKRKKKSSWTNPHRPLKFQWSKRFLGAFYERLIDLQDLVSQMDNVGMVEKFQKKVS